MAVTAPSIVEPPLEHSFQGAVQNPPTELQLAFSALLNLSDDAQPVAVTVRECQKNVEFGSSQLAGT